MDVYEGGIRVPFIANWPGTIPAGVSDLVSAQYDIMATLAELTGQDAGNTDIIERMTDIVRKEHQPAHIGDWEFIDPKFGI